MNPQLQAILAGLGNQGMGGMGTAPPRMAPPPILPPGMPLPQASQNPGGGMGVPAGHEITIKGPPPPKPPEQAQPSKPRTMAPPAAPAMQAPGPTPQQQNPGMPLLPGQPQIQDQNAPGASMIPAAPLDPMSMIRRLFGGPAMSPSAPMGVPGTAANG